MKKTIVRMACFITILFVVLVYVNHVLSFKHGGGISQTAHYYDLKKNTVDVLIIGSSHAYVNFNNGDLFEKYGIASYSIGGPAQPMWNSYYTLKEALKTQTPELIILEGYGTVFDYEYADDSTTVKSTFGMKWSLNKIKDILVSVDPKRRKDFLLTNMQYHSRYYTLDRGDFLSAFGTRNPDYNWYADSWKGQCLYNVSNERQVVDVSGVDFSTGLYPKVEEYYRKTIELANENNIPILVVITPYALTEYQQGKFNRAEEIASEYGVSFLNCNLTESEIGLNLKTDYKDVCHMTAAGTKIFAEYIGKYLKDNYEITDRRGDDRYQSWQEQADYVNKYIENSKVLTINNLDKLSLYINNHNYVTIISVDGICTTSDEKIRKFCIEQGIDIDGTNSITLKHGKNVVWSEGTSTDNKYEKNKYHVFGLSHDAEANKNKIMIENEQVQIVQNGLNIVMYDPELNMIMDKIGVDTTFDCRFIRKD